MEQEHCVMLVVYVRRMNHIDEWGTYGLTHYFIVYADYAKLVRNGSLGNTQSTDQQQHLSQDSASQNQYSGYPPPTLSNTRYHSIHVASPFPNNNNYAYGSRENDQHTPPCISDEGSMGQSSSMTLKMEHEEIGRRDQ